jgi:hypothetical protein
MTKESVDAAKSDLDSMKAAWSDASNAASSGHYTTAVSKAQAIWMQAGMIMVALEMTSS